MCVLVDLESTHSPLSFPLFTLSLSIPSQYPSTPTTTCTYLQARPTQVSTPTTTTLHCTSTHAPTSRPDPPRSQHPHNYTARHMLSQAGHCSQHPPHPGRSTPTQSRQVNTHPIQAGQHPPHPGRSTPTPSRQVNTHPITGIIETPTPLHVASLHTHITQTDTGLNTHTTARNYSRQILLLRGRSEYPPTLHQRPKYAQATAYSQVWKSFRRE